MLSSNVSKGVIGYPRTPFNTYEQIKYVFRDPRTPRDICCHEMCQKGLSTHMKQLIMSLGVLEPLKTCLVCLNRLKEVISYLMTPFHAFDDNICP